MLDDAQTTQMLEVIAKSKLGRENVVRVFTEPWSDLDGKDALRITIVITPGAVDRIKGDDLVDNLVDIRTRLYEAHDERTPFVTYATEEELAVGDDPEC
jgi:hypothetical protein